MRGLKDKIKRCEFYNYLRQKQIDIGFIQETHCTKKERKWWRNQWGGEMYFSDGESNSKGVAIVFAQSFDFKVEKIVQDDSGRALLMHIQTDNGSLLLVNIYAPNEDQPMFFDWVIKHLDSFDVDHVIWGGDFNKCLTDKDRKSKKEILLVPIVQTC